MRLHVRPTLFTSTATIASAALFAAVSAWAAHVLLAPLPHANPAVVAPAQIDALGGAALFGAAPDQGDRDDVQLLGLLAFDPHHAAAIVSVGGDAAHVVALNGALGSSTTLAEVRHRSIVVERNGVRREIALPAVESPSVFVR